MGVFLGQKAEGRAVHIARSPANSGSDASRTDQKPAAAQTARIDLFINMLATGLALTGRFKCIPDVAQPCAR
jgi:hypothetical protein